MRRIIISILFISTCLGQDKSIILWDLHNVIFNQKNPIPVIITYPNLYQVISHTSWSLAKDLIYELLTNLIYQKSTLDYLKIIRKHNNPYFEDLIIYVANALYIQPAMDNIIHELALLGHPQHVGSNIGAKAFKQLIDPQLYPEFASIFDKFDIPASQTAQYIDDQLIQKPNPDYFQLYLEKNNLNPFYNHIIFIDESQYNIYAAKKLGFDTILFKNPYQLRTELRKRGINITPSPYKISHQTSSHALYNPAYYIKPSSI